ncbi:hypothetical protein CVIRNUC_005758 [Coccomyxa viridis]|uniref:Uncharacterized protein n=1 Tax=Coccomyxa viridis TaxID=1274662 RepID=A0AAV1I9Q6_9CHLO|nr:hypothetical protein CVIRNUC_005758 [Coccomyxa viridis]
MMRPNASVRPQALCLQGGPSGNLRSLHIAPHQSPSHALCDNATSCNTGRLSRAFAPLSHQGGAASSSRCTVAHAQGRRRSGDDDVDLDDEEHYDEDQGFGVTAVLRQAWGAVSNLTERLADVAYDYVPESVSRPTVVLAVRAALILLIIGFARSILGFVFTAGTVVLGLFVASKVLGMDIGGSGQGQRRGGSGQKWGSGRWK